MEGKLDDSAMVEEEQNQADGVWNPVLSDEIAEAEALDEFEAVSLGAELCESYEPFAPCAEDEEKLNECRSYTLQRIPPSLQRELDTFKDFRIKRLVQIIIGPNLIPLKYILFH